MYKPILQYLIKQFGINALVKGRSYGTTPNKYKKPHQGAQEIARRKRQLDNGQIYNARGIS